MKHLRLTAWALGLLTIAVHAAGQGQKDEALPDGVPIDFSFTAHDKAPPVTTDEAVLSVRVPGVEGLLELAYAQRYGGWLVTYHYGTPRIGKRSDALERTAIYHRTHRGWVLKAEWVGGIDASLEQPKIFGIHHKEYHTCLWVPGRHNGTGNQRADAVYELKGGGAVKEIAFEPAPAGYLRLHKDGQPAAVMNPGEGIWKGEMNRVHDPGPGSNGYQVSFTFYIWNEGDGNASPTAGKVEGAYELSYVESGLALSIGSFKRTDFDKP